MMMPDRSRPPRLHPIEKLSLPQPDRMVLDNGLPVYVLSSGRGEVIKLELVIRAGRPVEHKRLVARATLRQLREGSRQRDGAALAEGFDFYGSSLSMPFNLDTAQVHLYGLVRQVDALWPLLAEMLAMPVFPESELEEYARRSMRRLEVELRKPDVVAYREFTADLYGADHPYGYNSSPADYEALQRDDLERHWRDHYHSGNSFLVLSGGVDAAVLRSLNRHLGQALPPGRATDRPPPAATTRPRSSKLDFPDAGQTAIRVGKRLFARQHPDYEGMQILANALGGYFGSRLMANIREDKGYTYNIYAMTDTLVHDGSFYVATEVGNAVVEPTLTEIYREMERLRTEPISEEELEMLRNYLLGTYLSALDGPFNQAELIRNLLIDKLPLSAFDAAVDTLRAMTPRKLQDLAQTHLEPASMWQMVVGP